MKKILLFLFISINAFAQSVTKTINLLPDTGQNLSYTNTFGEDNDYQINQPSYTDNGNGTITDNVTGLMWQKVDGGEMTIENANAYCDNLVLGGYSDWRLPSPMESFSILIHQNNNPAMNTTFFPSSGAEYWWTSTYQTGDNTKVWCTNAGGGIGNKPKTETISAGGTFKFHVRAVRTISVPTMITNHFTDNNDGTIIDNLTQLIWQKVPNTATQTWENALIYAENLNLTGASDWRLPNIKELQSLNDESVANPSTNTTFFPAIGVHNYWSSTSLPNQTTKAWYWNTQFGITTYDVKTNTNYVLCVRGIPTSLTNANYENNLTIKCSSNPFTNHILLVNTIGNEYFQLYTNLGQLIFQGYNIETQDFSLLTKGIYYLKIKTQSSGVIKLIKE